MSGSAQARDAAHFFCWERMPAFEVDTGIIFLTPTSQSGNCWRDVAWQLNCPRAVHVRSPCQPVNYWWAATWVAQWIWSPWATCMPFPVSLPIRWSAERRGMSSPTGQKLLGSPWTVFLHPTDQVIGGEKRHERPNCSKTLGQPALFFLANQVSYYLFIYLQNF